MKPEIICMGCQVCCSNTDDYRLELGNQSIRDLILSISPSLTDDRCNSELEVEFKQKKKCQKIVENDRFYGAIMLQERLHKHILVTIEQQRNTGTRRETAALNKRLQFPLYAQTGSHYAWCSLSVTSRWRLERARRTAAEENVLRDFTKPSSFMSCFYRAVCARRQWCIHVGRKQWAECNEHSTDSDNTGQETYATVHTYMSKKLWEQHAVCRKKQSEWQTAGLHTKKHKWLVRWELRWTVGGAGEICIAAHRRLH